MRSPNRIENDTGLPGNRSSQVQEVRGPCWLPGSRPSKVSTNWQLEGAWAVFQAMRWDLGISYRRKIRLGTSLVLLTCVRAQLYLTLCDLWTAGCQAPVLFPSPGALPHLRLLHQQVDSLPLSHLGSPVLLTATCERGSDPSSPPGLAPGTPPLAAPSAALASRHSGWASAPESVCRLSSLFRSRYHGIYVSPDPVPFLRGEVSIST